METLRLQVAGKPFVPENVPGLPDLLNKLAVDISSYSPDGNLVWVQCDGIAHLDRLMQVSDKDLFTTLFLMCECREDHFDALSEKCGRLVKAVQVRDLGGLSITGLLRDRAIMARLKEALRVVNNSFPETVYRLVLFNLPPGFSLLWAALQPMLNPHVRKKFVFLNKDNYLRELASLIGTQGLEALVRARRHKYNGVEPIEGLEVQHGLAEYACQRLSGGSLVEWSFKVGPAKVGGSLHFSLTFIEDAPGACIREVRASSSVVGAVASSFRAKAPGILWFTWTNPGSWARSKRVEALQITVHTAAEEQLVHTPSGPHQRRWQKNSSQQRPPVRECGCFSLLSLFGPGAFLLDPDAARASAEKAYAEVSAAPALPKLETAANLDSDGCRQAGRVGSGKGGHMAPFLKILAVVVAFMLVSPFLPIFQEEITPEVA